MRILNLFVVQVLHSSVCVLTVLIPQAICSLLMHHSNRVKITDMKKYSILKKSLTAIMLVLMMLPAFTSCDKDQFADINTNPSTISKGNIPYLFTQAVLNVEPSDDLRWFYDGRYTSNVVQAFVPGSY